MNYAPAAKALLPYLKNDDAKVRQAAAQALRAIGNAEVAEDLLPYLTDKDLVVRRSVARALEIMAPEKLAEGLAKQALDATQDDNVRVTLLGAVQLHGSAKLAYQTASAILNSPAPASVRKRASYAIGRVATKENLDDLLKWVGDEKDDYVLIRLGWTLNNVTGVKVVIDGKTSTFPKSEPGKRQEFIDQWAGKKAANAA
jgi:HEAT repeat protein